MLQCNVRFNERRGGPVPDVFADHERGAFVSPAMRRHAGNTGGPERPRTAHLVVRRDRCALSLAIRQVPAERGKELRGGSCPKPAKRRSKKRPAAWR
jgi:hypothetical protein